MGQNYPPKWLQLFKLKQIMLVLLYLATNWQTIIIWTILGIIMQTNKWKVSFVGKFISIPFNSKSDVRVKNRHG